MVYHSQAVVWHLFYRRQFRKYVRMQGFPAGKAEGEDAYKAKWRQLARRVEPWSYRFFIHYVGHTPDIVPEDIGHMVIENTLNPRIYRDYYSDKNIFPQFVPAEALPATIVCRMGGSQLLDANHAPATGRLNALLEPYSRVILKPSTDTNSGLGVMLFTKSDGVWRYAKDKETVLSEEFLLAYRDDFVLQEALSQHADLARLCSTAINTLRIAVYRSVKDEQPHVIAAVLRIGHQGEFVDNAHAGGRSTGINLETGELQDRVFDQYGRSYSTWNEIDFSKNHFTVPAWQEAKQLACTVSSRLRHMRLTAYDIAIDASGHPKLVEFNVDGFAFWIFYYAHQLPLGTYTDEIIDYCKQKRR